MDRWIGIAGAVMRGSQRAAEGITDAVTSGVGRARISPSRAAIRTGILCPGDGPPSGSIGSFRDYRGILLPRQVAALRTGLFPIGAVKNPRAESAAFPVFLDWDEVHRHVVIVGPAGSGKTRNLITPWAIAAASSGITTILIDTKGDMMSHELPDARRSSGIVTKAGVIQWDVDSPAEAWSWNPLSEVSDSQIAAQIAQSFLGEVDPQDRNRWFMERDHRWLRGLALLVVAALGLNAHPAELYRAVVDQSVLVDLAARAPHAAYDLLDLIQFPSSDYARATSGLATRLSWLADPALKNMLSGRGPRSFKARDALDSGAIVLVGMRASGGERAAMAASLLLNMLKMACMQRFSGSHRQVIWLIDEAPKVAVRLKLDEMLDLLRGAGSPVCIALQDVTQFGDVNQQTRMLANCDTSIVLSGASPAAAQFFSNRFGSGKSASVTSSMDTHGRFSPTLSHPESPRLGVDEIMYPPVGRFGGIVQIKAASPHPFLITFDL